MKKCLALILSALVLLSSMCFSVSAEVGELFISVDDVALSESELAFIENDRTLIPVRSLCNALGISDENITLSNDILTVKTSVMSDECVITLPLGSLSATKNGEEIILDAPARLVDGKTFVPLRFVSEAFGALVDFIPAPAELAPIRNLITIQTVKNQPLKIFMPTEAKEAGAADLFTVAAAITGLTNVSIIEVGEEDRYEKAVIALSTDTPLIFMDTGFMSESLISTHYGDGRLLPIGDLIARLAPAAKEWIDSDEELLAKISASDGNMIAFPVENGEGVDRFFVMEDANAYNAVSLIHAYREIVLSLQG
ncbi:MAG: hypothetical protein IJA08_05145 [Clostridia bacterium]|nr:hypothetical protein [Clostridia bacterium]